jgi:hypothetical protein
MDTPQTLWTRINTDVKTLWAKDRVFLIIFGVLILMAKASSLLMAFYSAKAKAELNAAVKQDASLKAQETAANNQADALVKEADALPSQEAPVDANWDKKK